MQMIYLYRSEDEILTRFGNRETAVEEESPRIIKSSLSGKIQCDGATYEIKIYQFRLSEKWVAEISIDGGPLVPCGHNYISDKEAWEILRAQIEFCTGDFEVDEALFELAPAGVNSAKQSDFIGFADQLLF